MAKNKKKETKATKVSENLLKVITFSERIPYASKMANNCAWGKLMVDAYDVQYSDALDDEYIKRVEDNYRLLNGLSMKNYTSGAYKASLVDIMDIQSEGIDMPSGEMEHFDFVSPYIDGQWGDQKRRRLEFSVTDSSKFTQNYIKKYREDALKSHFETKLITPIKQFALAKWQMDNGVQDMQQLPPEELQKVQAQVNASAESMIPQDIALFMKKGAMGQVEKEGQGLGDALVATLDLKYKIDEEYRHSYATDGIVFYSGIRRGKPFTKRVDCSQFNTGGSDEIFIDNNPWFKVVTYEHPSKIWAEYSDQWNRTDIAKFDAMLQLGEKGTVQDYKDEKFVANVDFAGQELLQNTNLLTKEGQQQYSGILQKYSGPDSKNFEKLRVVHIVWLSLDKFKRIERLDEDNTITYHYFDESYVFNPQNGDIEEKILWVPRYWEGKKIGNGEAVYADVGPVEHQNRDITDPFIVRSPFTGGFLHDMNGKGHRRSPLDKVKPFIHAANFQMKTIRDREATDIGKVVLTTVAAKPKGWSWGKLIEVARATKMLPINTQTSGLTAADVQFFREIDLSNLYDILPRINYLMFLIQRIGEGLSSNSARQGNPAASTSVSNNNANLNRSFSQTHARAAWVDKITERLLENLIYYAKQSVKEGNIFMRYALDDLSIASIDIDVAALDDALFGVKVSTEPVDLQKLDVSRNILMPFIQNKGLSYQLAMETLYASSRGEFMHIASKAEMEAEIKNAQAMDFQKMSAEEQQRKTLEIEQALLELKSNLKMREDVPNNEAKKEMAALSSMTLSNANDINKDGQNDFVQSAALDREFKREELFVKDRLERDKLALENVWETEDLRLLNKKVEVLEKNNDSKSKKG